MPTYALQKSDLEFSFGGHVSPDGSAHLLNDGVQNLLIRHGVVATVLPASIIGNAGAFSADGSVFFGTEVSGASNLLFREQGGVISYPTPPPGVTKVIPHSVSPGGRFVGGTHQLDALAAPVPFVYDHDTGIFSDLTLPGASGTPRVWSVAVDDNGVAMGVYSEEDGDARLYAWPTPTAPEIVETLDVPADAEVVSIREASSDFSRLLIRYSSGGSFNLWFGYGFEIPEPPEVGDFHYYYMSKDGAHLALSLNVGGQDLSYICDLDTGEWVEVPGPDAYHVYVNGLSNGARVLSGEVDTPDWGVYYAARWIRGGFWTGFRNCEEV